MTPTLYPRTLPIQRLIVPERNDEEPEGGNSLVQDRWY